MARRAHVEDEEDETYNPMEEDELNEENQVEDETMKDVKPDVTEGENDNRTELRRKFRSYNMKMEEHIHDPTNTSVGVLTKDLNQMNKLFRHVKAPREAALDSRWLMMASDIGATKAKLLKHDAGAFEVDDFISKLILDMGGAEDDGEELDGAGWAKIGRKALAKSRRVPTIGFMLGPLSAEAKKRAVRQRTQLDKSGEAAKPQELKEDDLQRSENETAANVLAVERILSQAGEINIFRFVVNPNDFAESVENIFYLSFLIRDGKCSLSWSEGENPEPVILLTEPPTEDDYTEGAKKQQLVLEFDQATWKRAIEEFDIRESMIPSRPKPVLRIAGKWYG